MSKLATPKPPVAEFDLRRDLLDSNSSLIKYFNLEDINLLRKNYADGLSRYTEKIKVEVVSDLKKCKLLWQEFSAMNSLFDTWNFRYYFHKRYRCLPYFLTIKRDNQPQAVLPLCFDFHYKEYQWFGTYWQEDNTFFAKDYFYVPLLLYLAPKPLCLNTIREESAKKVPPFLKLKNDYPKYILELEKIKSLEDYLTTLKKKKRYNLKRDKKHIEAFNPKIVINQFSDYEQMVELCKRRFRLKGDMPDFEEEPPIRFALKDAILGGEGVYKPKMISIYIKGKLAGADIIIIFKDNYYLLHGGGYDTFRYSGIGNYMNLIEIEDAISLGMRKVDFLQYDYNWKKSWFPETPLYIYEA